MRLHRNLVFASIDTLDEIFNNQTLADRAINNTLKRDKRWGSRDRAFIAETVYDIVRWKRLYEEIAEVRPPYSRHNLFRLFAVWATLKGIAIPEWKQFENTPTRRIKGKFDSYLKDRKIRESIPDWLDEIGINELGGKWEKELTALNRQADVILRVNTLKSTLVEVQQVLNEDNIQTKTISGHPNALQLIERTNVFNTSLFQNGAFEVQDAASQKVAVVLNPKPGMRVIDACAGAGGKTLHIAALMENKGQIIALDVYPKKLNELKRRAKRAGAFNIETKHIDSTKVIKKLHGSADCVLLDAPCSGLGVLRRNPDTKWKLTPEFLDEIRQTQAEILIQYSKMVKVGGRMVYATCSILPSENELQIEKFLTTDSGKMFKLVKELKLTPSQFGFDGFYIALLEKIH